MFAAIVRTRGTRPHQLLEALESLRLQALPCVPVVVVHGDSAALDRVGLICKDETPPPRILRASDTSRTVGYPINVGIDHCLAQIPDARYLFLLDDDDIVYPYFTSQIAAAFEESEADVVYASSNRREPGQAAVRAHLALPAHHLLRENFIPTNTFVMRADALRGCNVRADEALRYFEDWHFLLRLLEAGLRFHAVPATLSEFRIVPDSDLSYRRDLTLWRANEAHVRSYINRTSFPLPGAELAQIDSGATPVEAGSRPADQLLIGRLRQRVGELENSLSWRWTAPARSLLDAVLGWRRRKDPRR